MLLNYHAGFDAIIKWKVSILVLVANASESDEKVLLRDGIYVSILVLVANASEYMNAVIEMNMFKGFQSLF